MQIKVKAAIYGLLLLVGTVITVIRWEQSGPGAALVAASVSIVVLAVVVRLLFSQKDKAGSGQGK